MPGSCVAKAPRAPQIVPRVERNNEREHVQIPPPHPELTKATSRVISNVRAVGAAVWRMAVRLESAGTSVRKKGRTRPERQDHRPVARSAGDSA